MCNDAAFSELWERHEELTTRFAQLLHDDAGQVLTSIALQLSVIDHPDVARLQETLDDLLDRFRQAQASLGGAVVGKRGLSAGLSQLARARPDLHLRGEAGPNWPLLSTRAAFRVVEALTPKQILWDAESVTCDGCLAVSPYTSALAAAGGLVLHSGPRPTTIRITHANQGLNC